MTSNDRLKKYVEVFNFCHTGCIGPPHVYQVYQV